MVAARAPQREEYLEKVLVHVRQRLEEMGIAADVTGRPKHLWSIYEKMVVRGKEFDDINDLVAIRVVVESEKDCWAALGAIHAIWAPVHGRFKDYINTPKFNMYQSLHTTVIGLEGKPVEVQIRTSRDAPPRRVRHRGALGLQVQGGPLLGDGLAPAHRRRRPPDRRPDRVPRGAEARPGAGRGLRLHAQGQGDRAAGPLDAGRLRLRHPHRGGPPLHRGAGQRPAGAARDPARAAPTPSRSSPRSRRRAGPVAGLAADRRLDPGPQQDPPVVLPGAARGRHRERPGGAGPGAAPGRPAAAQAAGVERAAAGGRVDEPGRPRRALRLHRREPGLGPVDRPAPHQGAARRRRGRRAAPDDRPARAPAGRARGAAPAPASTSRGSTTS